MFFVQASACMNSMCLNSHVTTEGPITKGKLSELIDMMQITSAENTGTMPHLDKMINSMSNDNGNWTSQRLLNVYVHIFVKHERTYKNNVVGSRSGINHFINRMRELVPMTRSSALLQDFLKHLSFYVLFSAFEPVPTDLRHDDMPMSNKFWDLSENFFLFFFISAGSRSQCR